MFVSGDRVFLALSMNLMLMTVVVDREVVEDIVEKELEKKRIWR